MNPNETKQIIDKLNYLETRLNQLMVKFNAHRDKKDIHKKHEVE